MLAQTEQPNALHRTLRRYMHAQQANKEPRNWIAEHNLSAGHSVLRCHANRRNHTQQQQQQQPFRAKPNAKTSTLERLREKSDTLRRGCVLQGRAPPRETTRFPDVSEPPVSFRFRKIPVVARRRYIFAPAKDARRNGELTRQLRTSARDGGLVLASGSRCGGASVGVVSSSSLPPIFDADSKYNNHAGVREESACCNDTEVRRYKFTKRKKQQSNTQFQPSAGTRDRVRSSAKRPLFESKLVGIRRPSQSVKEAPLTPIGDGELNVNSKLRRKPFFADPN